jgi:acetyl esterase/lipase
MMLDLTDEETDALARLLSRTIDDDRYPLSPRIQNLKGILAKIRPEPVREPLPRSARSPRSSLRRCARHCLQRESEIYAEKLRAAGVAVASSRLP